VKVSGHRSPRCIYKARVADQGPVRPGSDRTSCTASVPRELSSFAASAVVCAPFIRCVEWLSPIFSISVLARAGIPSQTDGGVQHLTRTSGLGFVSLNRCSNWAGSFRSIAHNSGVKPLGLFPHEVHAQYRLDETGLIHALCDGVLRLVPAASAMKAPGLIQTASEFQHLRSSKSLVRARTSASSVSASLR
jgi:hypothetical protein